VPAGAASRVCVLVGVLPDGNRCLEGGKGVHLAQQCWMCAGWNLHSCDHSLFQDADDAVLKCSVPSSGLRRA
jgi:hypothetical protein